MAVGTVRTTDFLVTTTLAPNTSQAIGAVQVEDEAESAGGMAHSTQTASYTALITDRGTCVEMNVASANNFTIVTAANMAGAIGFPIDATLTVCQLGAGQTTVVSGTGSPTIRTPSSLLLRAQNSTVTLRQRALNDWVISGDLV